MSAAYANYPQEEKEENRWIPLKDSLKKELSKVIDVFDSELNGLIGEDNLTEVGDGRWGRRGGVMLLPCTTLVWWKDWVTSIN